MIGKILCLFGRHHYRLGQEFDGGNRRVACRRCGRMFAMSDEMQIIVPWDAKFHRMYESHGHWVIYKDWEGGK